MRAFTSDELSGMQGTQESAMMDRCTILVYTSRGSDEYGMPVTLWVEGANVACGLDMAPRREWNAPAGAGDQTQVEAGEARIRLPIDTEISNLERIRITHRFGEMLLTPLEYELIEGVRRGPSGLVARCQLVNGF